MCGERSWQEIPLRVSGFFSGPINCRRHPLAPTPGSESECVKTPKIPPRMNRELIKLKREASRAVRKELSAFGDTLRHLRLADREQPL